MAAFVHLTRHSNIPSIRRGGLTVGKRRFRPRGVYALPITQSFAVSHQWVRELRRSSGGTIVAVYFRIPDDEPVEVGHFNSRHVSMTASEAVALMWSAEQRDPCTERRRDAESKAVKNGARLPGSPEGYEVIIPRAVEASAVFRVRAVPQVVGWRYKPGAHGHPPCACLCCERGTYGIRKLLRVVEEAEARGKPTKIILFGREDDSYLRVEQLRKKLASE